MPSNILKITTAFVGLTLFSCGLVCAQPEIQGIAPQYSPKVSQWLAELETKKNVVAAHKTKGVSSAAHKAVSSNHAAGSQVVKKTGQGPDKISVDFYKVDIHNVFRLLGEVSGKNIVVDEDVTGTLTLALKDVPWRFVLDVIKNLKDLSSIERHNTIMIYPSSKKITWVGEAGKESGSLTIAKKPKLKKKALTVKRKGRQTTPVHQIIEAKKYLDKASAQEASGNYVDALKFYKKASDLWPDNATISKKAASLALGPVSDPITALNYAKRALKSDPKDGDAALFAAIAYARLGKRDEARAMFERALADSPDNYEVLYNYTVFCFSQKLDRKAMRLIRRLEAQFPVSPDVMAIKAQILERLNHVGEAIKEYRAILNSGRDVTMELKMFASARIKELQASGN